GRIPPGVLKHRPPPAAVVVDARPSGHAVQGGRRRPPPGRDHRRGLGDHVPGGDPILHQVGRHPCRHRSRRVGLVQVEELLLAAARHRSLLAGCTTVSGVPILAASAWQLVFGLYGCLLSLALFAARISLAIWDLARRDDLSRPAIVAWIVAVLAVPFAG